MSPNLQATTWLWSSIQLTWQTVRDEGWKTQLTFIDVDDVGMADGGHDLDLAADADEIGLRFNLGFLDRFDGYLWVSRSRQDQGQFQGHSYARPIVLPPLSTPCPPPLFPIDSIRQSESQFNQESNSKLFQCLNHVPSINSIHDWLKVFLANVAQWKMTWDMGDLKKLK